MVKFRFGDHERTSLIILYTNTEGSETHRILFTYYVLLLFDKEHLYLDNEMNVLLEWKNELYLFPTRLQNRREGLQNTHDELILCKQ